MSKEVADWKEALISGAKKAIDSEKVAATAGMVSTRGGIFTLPDGTITKELTCVIIAYIAKRKWYEHRKFNADDKRPPLCFAQAVEEDHLVPHPNVPAPQAPSCSECPNAEWGSAPGESKAQWCKTSRELMVMLITPETTAATIAASDLLSISIPPTSIKTWSKYANMLANQGLPPWAASTKVIIEPSKWQASTRYELVTPLNQDAEIMSAIHARVQPTEDAMLDSAYSYEEDEDGPKANY